MTEAPVAQGTWEALLEEARALRAAWLTTQQTILRNAVRPATDLYVQMREIEARQRALAERWQGPWDSAPWMISPWFRAEAPFVADPQPGMQGLWRPFPEIVIPIVLWRRTGKWRDGYHWYAYRLDEPLFPVGYDRPASERVDPSDVRIVRTIPIALP
jgi:hypothetical protein